MAYPEMFYIEEDEIGRRDVSLYSLPNASRVPVYIGGLVLDALHTCASALREIVDTGGDSYEADVARQALESAFKYALQGRAGVGDE